MGDETTACPLCSDKGFQLVEARNRIRELEEQTEAAMQAAERAADLLKRMDEDRLAAKAKLAKAVEALTKAAEYHEDERTWWDIDRSKDIRATLAELGEGDDGRFPERSCDVHFDICPVGRVGEVAMSDDHIQEEIAKQHLGIRDDAPTQEMIPKDVALAMVATSWGDGVRAAAHRYKILASPDTWDFSYEANDAILGLLDFAPADAKAALDRLITEAKEKGFWIGRKTSGSKDEIDAALNAIRRGDDG